MIRCAIILFFTCFLSLTLGITPIFASGHHCENAESSDAEVKLELEEEDFIATNQQLELSHFTFLFILREFPEHFSSDYVVYLSRRVIPPRVQLTFMTNIS